MEYNIKEILNMTDMEYDIFTRNADYSQNEDDWKTIVVGMKTIGKQL
jgi:hypothetical protein